MKKGSSVKAIAPLHMWQAVLLLLAVLFFMPALSEALEVYSLVKNGCEAETGLIVHADDMQIHMLNLNGELAVLDRNNVEVILVYNIPDNPVGSLDLSSGLYDSLREVEVDDIEKTHFIGWPIRFIEDLIMFYDIDGKTHLVDLDKIKTFTYPDDIERAVRPVAIFQLYHFGLGENLPECKTDEGDKGQYEGKYIEPTRMISDRIQVHKFLSVYQAGFAHLKRFQKKTVFYAKPFLYEKESRIGLVYTMPEYLHEPNFPMLPLYYQWSSGDPYDSQGQYVAGSRTVNLLPSVEPHFIFRADGKSHLFTGTFVGNMMCLSGGRGCIIENRGALTETFRKVDDNDHVVFSQFNYLALTGVEYKEYSLSAGFYYPIYGIWGNGIFREVISNRSSPLIRLKWMTSDLDIKLIYSQSHLYSDSPSDSGIELIQTDELKDYAMLSDTSSQLIVNLERYDLKTRFIRMDINYDLTDTVKLGFSEFALMGKYSERYAGVNYDLDFLHLTSYLFVKQSFGNYIAVKGEVAYSANQHDYTTGGISGESDQNNISFAISIEFML